MSLFTLLLRKNTRIPSATMVRPTKRKASSIASQGFPLNQMPQNAHVEKKLEFWDVAESLTS